MSIRTDTKPDPQSTQPSRPVAEQTPAEQTPAEQTALAASALAASDLDEVQTLDYRGPDRRNPDASRRKPMGFFSLRQLSGHRERRHPGRRAEDWEKPYVDWYEPRLMALVVGIVLLVVADTFLTLELWQHGLIDLSPLMMALIENDIHSYINIKIAVTSLALMLMVVYKNFTFYRVFRVSHLLYTLFGAYLLIVGNEFYVWLNLP